MVQDASNDDGLNEPDRNVNQPQDVAARWRKPSAGASRAYPAPKERLPPPRALVLSFILWLVAALPVGALMATTATNSAHLDTVGTAATSEVVIGTILYFAILSIFPWRMLVGRQWARVWLLVVGVLWTLLWFPRLLTGSLLAAPTERYPFTRNIDLLVGFVLSTPIDEPVTLLAAAFLFSVIVVIMICASILMFTHTSSEFFREVRAARR